MIRSPFIFHEGTWYLIVGWEPGRKAMPKLRLRPLTADETKILEEHRENFDAEAWALIAAKDHADCQFACKCGASS